MGQQIATFGHRNTGRIGRGQTLFYYCIEPSIINSSESTLTVSIALFYHNSTSTQNYCSTISWDAILCQPMVAGSGTSLEVAIALSIIAQVMWNQQEQRSSRDPGIYYERTRKIGIPTFDGRAMSDQAEHCIEQFEQNFDILMVPEDAMPRWFQPFSLLMPWNGRKGLHQYTDRKESSSLGFNSRRFFWRNIFQIPFAWSDRINFSSQCRQIV